MTDVRVVAGSYQLRLLGAIDLRDAQGRPVTSVLAQPKRLGLLAYLTLASDMFVRRDALLALFWPEFSEDQARSNLRQSVHYLRRELGTDVVVSRSDDALAIAPQVIECDVAAFGELLDRGAIAAAMPLYRGDLLPGFFMPGVAPELEQWLDALRVRLRDRAARSAIELSTLLERDGTISDAIRWARWACDRVPENEAMFRRLVALLDRAGDRFGALLAYDQFADRLAKEFGVEPSPETAALLRAIRARDEQATDPPRVSSSPPPTPSQSPDALVDSPAATVAPLPPVPATHPPIARRGVRRWARIGAVLTPLLIAAALLVVIRNRTGPAEARPTHPALARQLYERGVAAKVDGDSAGARRFFVAALDEDSTLAIAAWSAIDYAADSAASRRLWGIALRHADAAPDRDRLRVKLEWARLANDPTELAFADSLRKLDPRNPEGHLEYATSLTNAADYTGGLAAIRLAIASDTAGFSKPPAACGMCDAYGLLIGINLSVDSTDAAERTAREWIQRQPDDYRAWRALALTLAVVDRATDARAAWTQALALRPELAHEYVGTYTLDLFLGQYADVDRYLADVIREGSAAARSEARFWQVTSLRNQGRLRDALTAADTYERESARDGVVGAAIPRAIVLLELGRAPEARAIFESVAGVYPQGWFELPSLRARHRAWSLTRVATAAAAMGDTASLVMLADSIERAGRSSPLERDRRLHHYVRANILAARGSLADAAEAYRRSIHAPTVGYTRINVELGHVLIALGRSREAVGIVRAALHGGLESTNLYVTRTELHALLARAFDSAGAPDSAAAHYERVAAAWSAGDPPFRARADSASARAAILRAATRVAARRD